MNIKLILSYYATIMLNILSVTYYAQNFAGILSFKLVPIDKVLRDHDHKP